MGTIRALAMVVAIAVSSAVQGQVSSPAQPAKRSVAEQVTQLKIQWLDAERARDMKFLQQLFAEDFVVGTSQGDVLNKAQLLERLSLPDRKIEELHSDNVEVRVYGNVAILTDHTTLRGHDKGSAFGGEFRYVRIFVQQHGKWQAVLAQATPLKPAPSPAQ
jgi:ketosteroid isomerase-like protein